MEESYSDKIKRKRQEAAAAKKRENELKETINATIGGSDTVAQEVARQAAKSRRTTQKVKIENDDLAKSNDVQGVVDSLNKLNLTTFLASKDNWAQVVDDVAAAAERIQKATDNLDGGASKVNDSLADAISSLQSAVEMIRTIKVESDPVLVEEVAKLNESLANLDVSPIVNVPAPRVTVSSPTVDLSGVEKAVKSLKDQPVPEKDLELEDFVGQDIDNDMTGLQYVGLTHMCKDMWLFIENDTDKGTLRFAIGNGDYAKAWKDHIQKAYKLWGQAVNEVQA